MLNLLITYLLVIKVATLTYKVLSTQQPAYLRNLISYHYSST